MSGLIVMKFGGTSMGSAERIRACRTNLRRDRAKRPAVVVVSAMSKITDLLLETLRAAESRRSGEVEANLKHLETGTWKHAARFSAGRPAPREFVKSGSSSASFNESLTAC